MSEEAPKAEEPETPFGNELLIVAAAGTALTTLFHAPAFYNFFTQWQAIAASGVTGDDFWAPLQVRLRVQQLFTPAPRARARART